MYEWAVTKWQRRRPSFPTADPNGKDCRRSDTHQARSRARFNTDRNTAVDTRRVNFRYCRTPYNTFHSSHRTVRSHISQREGIPQKQRTERTGGSYRIRGYPVWLRSERRLEGGRVFEGACLPDVDGIPAYAQLFCTE